MKKQSKMNSLFEFEDEQDLKNTEDSRYTDEFDTRAKNLEDDILNVDQRLGNIQLYITGLDTQISNLRNTIKNEKDNAKKGKLYEVINNCLKILSEYQNLYLKGLDIKRNYRSEQNELTLRKIRFWEVELRKMQTDDAMGMNNARLVEHMNNLQKSVDEIISKKSKTPEAPVINEEPSIFDVEEKYKT